MHTSQVHACKCIFQRPLTTVYVNSFWTLGLDSNDTKILVNLLTSYQYFIILPIAFSNLVSVKIMIFIVYGKDYKLGEFIEAYGVLSFLKK